ncbi:MAG: hypothetical protein OXH38_12310 [Chloroflexi bacterium]|nr:hypothetical protein [Chloroflexota bacterium]
MPNLPGLRGGFAWWLPPLTAVLGALIAVLLSQSMAAAWSADVHLWARDGRPPGVYADLVLDRSVQASATESMMASESGVPRIGGVAVELTDTLIRVTVQASAQADAEALALSLAHAVVDEAHVRYGDEAGLDLLGLVRPGARKIAPATEWSAAWASAVGLLVGLALAAATARVTRSPASNLGRIGRLGLRPIAVVSDDAERRAQANLFQVSGDAVRGTTERGSMLDDAVQLANALNPVSGIVAFTPLDAASDLTGSLIRAAQTLAARGNVVIWLDARRPAFELTYTEPPDWLQGASWSPPYRSELILREAARALRPNGYVMVPTDPLSDPSAREFARSAVGVVLIARADAEVQQLIQARDMLRSMPLLGVVLSHAPQRDLHEFELAHPPD